jgi:hypothetical protein
MANTNPKEWFRAFLDFLILFTGISTASNLKRTQGRPLRTRGLFLFRTKKKAIPNGTPSE